MGKMESVLSPVTAQQSGVSHGGLLHSNGAESVVTCSVSCETHSVCLRERSGWPQISIYSDRMLLIYGLHAHVHLLLSS